MIHLPNLVDSHLFQDKVGELRNDKVVLRKSLDLPLDKQIVLAVGEVSERKGIDQLIRATLRTSGPCKIVVLGSGPRLSEWTEWIEREKLEYRIGLKGYCDEHTVAKYFAVADWFIHAARYDPSPLTCVEAVCAGLPISISNQTGNQPEVLDDWDNGFAFDVEDVNEVSDVLDRMVNTTCKQRQEFARRSEAIFAERFDADRVLSRFFATLKDL